MFLRERVHEKLLDSFLLLIVLVFAGHGFAYAEAHVIDKAARPMKKVTGEAKAAPAEAKAAPAEGTKKEEEKKEESNYFYDPAGMTDPFKSFIAEQEEVAEKQRRKPKTYLETLDLSQLELIAIVAGPMGNYAMVRDSKGIGHVIIKGTAIGTDGGVVDRITDREVVIKEEYKDFRGSIKQKEITKKLTPPMGR
jgi:Tfp pilus assembly protein PilP